VTRATIQELRDFSLNIGVIVEDRFIYCDPARLHGTYTNRPYVQVKRSADPDIPEPRSGDLNIRAICPTCRHGQVTAALGGEAGRRWDRLRVRDDTPGNVGAVGNRPRSNGGLALSTGRVFIPRVSGSIGQKVQHGAARSPAGRGGSRYSSRACAEPP
jgi:hypothetical protein